MVRNTGLVVLACVLLSACSLSSAPAEPAPSTYAPAAVAVQPLELKVPESRWLIFSTGRVFTPVRYLHALILPRDEETTHGRMRTCLYMVVDCEGEFTSKDFVLSQDELRVYRPSACSPNTDDQV